MPAKSLRVWRKAQVSEGDFFGLTNAVEYYRRTGAVNGSIVPRAHLGYTALSTTRINWALEATARNQHRKLDLTRLPAVLHGHSPAGMNQNVTAQVLGIETRTRTGSTDQYMVIELESPQLSIEKQHFAEQLSAFCRRPISLDQDVIGVPLVHLEGNSSVSSGLADEISEIIGNSLTLSAVHFDFDSVDPSAGGMKVAN